MQLTFSKNVIASKIYECSMGDFMKWHYRGYGRYGNELDIHVESGTRSGYLERVFCVTLTDNEINLDFNDNNNVKKVLTRWLKGQENTQ